MRWRAQATGPRRGHHPRALPRRQPALPAPSLGSDRLGAGRGCLQPLVRSPPGPRGVGHPATDLDPGRRCCGVGGEASDRKQRRWQESADGITGPQLHWSLDKQETALQVRMCPAVARPELYQGCPGAGAEARLGRDGLCFIWSPRQKRGPGTAPQMKGCWGFQVADAVGMQTGPGWLMPPPWDQLLTY